MSNTTTVIILLNYLVIRSKFIAVIDKAQIVITKKHHIQQKPYIQ